MKGKKIWDKSSFLKKVGFYLINWEEKLASQLGYIYEKIRKK
jgi:hypothetical protein